MAPAFQDVWYILCIGGDTLDEVPVHVVLIGNRVVK